jgi:hypothetical protein
MTDGTTAQGSEPLAPSVGQAPAHSLCGTWERHGLVGARQIKMFTEGHFLWVVHKRESGAALSVGGGTYCFDGVVLTEKYEYSNVPQLIGTEIKLTIVFQDRDTWSQAGTAAVPGISLDESYHRIG